MTDKFEGAGPEARFEGYLEEGKFMLQRSATDGTYIFYPRMINPHNGEADLEWVEASGEGEIYATTATSRHCFSTAEPRPPATPACVHSA